MKKLLDAHAKTAEERQALSERLESEAVERRKIEKTKGMLLGKLQAMEAKLIQASKRAPAGEKEGEHRKANAFCALVCVNGGSVSLTLQAWSLS